MRMTSVALALVCVLAGPSGPRAQNAADEGVGRDPGARSERKLPGGLGYVCTATNELHTAQCSVSCPSRETADCEDAEGGGPPTCRCGTGED